MKGLKKMKNVFRYMWKYFHFCPDFLIMKKNDSIRKLRHISKFMTSQTAEQIMAIHELTKISRSKSNRKIKFGQLIECNMKNVFLEKLYAKCGKEASPRSFYKNSKLSISLAQWSEMFFSLFLLYNQVEIYHNMLKLGCWPLAFILYKVFLKNKRRSRTSLLASFSA